MPDYANCIGRDFMDIYDYNLNEKNYLTSICRNDGYQQIMSTNNRLFLRFNSNYVNIASKTGIELTVRIWSKNLYTL